MMKRIILILLAIALSVIIFIAFIVLISYDPPKAETAFNERYSIEIPDGAEILFNELIEYKGDKGRMIIWIEYDSLKNK